MLPLKTSKSKNHCQRPAVSLRLARELRKLRKKFSGLTQVEAAQKVPISASTLCLFERGLVSLKPQQLAKLKSVLKRALRRNLLSPEARELMAGIEHPARMLETSDAARSVTEVTGG